MLEPLGWPATFFIISSRIGERAFLTAKQIKRLSTAGMDIGSHTVDHLELPSLSESSRAQQLSQSRKELEKVAGHPVRWFCYPAGRNDSASAASVAEAGYLLGYTTEGGSVLRADSLTQLPRVRVSGGGSLQQFAASVKAASAASQAGATGAPTARPLGPPAPAGRLAHADGVAQARLPVGARGHRPRRGA